MPLAKESKKDIDVDLRKEVVKRVAKSIDRCDRYISQDKYKVCHKDYPTSRIL